MPCAGVPGECGHPACKDGASKCAYHGLPAYAVRMLAETELMIAQAEGTAAAIVRLVHGLLSDFGVDPTSRETREIVHRRLKMAGNRVMDLGVPQRQAGLCQAVIKGRMCQHQRARPDGIYCRFHEPPHVVVKVSDVQAHNYRAFLDQLNRQKRLRRTRHGRRRSAVLCRACLRWWRKRLWEAITTTPAYRHRPFQPRHAAQ